jgi:hypothetical protein
LYQAYFGVFWHSVYGVNEAENREK